MWFDATQSIASTCGSMQHKVLHRHVVRCNTNYHINMRFDANTIYCIDMRFDANTIYCIDMRFDANTIYCANMNLDAQSNIALIFMAIQ